MTISSYRFSPRLLTLTLLASTGVGVGLGCHDLRTGTAPIFEDPKPETCDPSQQIAVIDGPACPEPSAGWTLEPMSPGPNGKLRCHYGSSDDSPDVEALAAVVGDALQPDCPLELAAAANERLANIEREDFERGFEHVGDPEGLLGQPSAGVIVAIVDTANRHQHEVEPMPLGGYAVAPAHGPAMAAIAAEAASCCVEDDVSCYHDHRDCVRKVMNFRGMSSEGHGNQSYLAHAIENVVNTWRKGQWAWSPSKHPKLIINLSLGWELSSHRADDVVLTAIEYATCHGAIVVAATGNASADASEGSLAPGIWEQRTRLSREACLDKFYAGQRSVGETWIPALDPDVSYRPLVYATTPLDFEHHNLADARPRANTRIAAVGYLGTADSFGERHVMLTGSSVSTAVVSGIAALAWSYYPDYSAEKLMEIIYESGTARAGVVADTCLAAAAPKDRIQREVSACEALSHACELADPESPRCASVRETCEKNNDVSIQEWKDAQAELQRIENEHWDELKQDRVGTKYLVVGTFGGDDRVDGPIRPQPNKPTCTTCQIDSGGEISFTMGCSGTSTSSTSNTNCPTPESITYENRTGGAAAISSVVSGSERMSFEVANFSSPYTGAPTSSSCPDKVTLTVAGDVDDCTPVAGSTSSTCVYNEKPTVFCEYQ